MQLSILHVRLMEDEIGSLEAGKRADVVLVDIDHPV